MLFAVETWILAIVFVILLAIYGIWPYGFFKKLNIPGPKPLPFIGTFHHNSKGFFNFDLECMQKYGKIWGIYDGRRPVLTTVDTSMIKTIWVKECLTTFTNRRNFGLNGKLDSALTVVEDEQWKRIRSVLSPNFTSGRLKEIFPIIKQYSEILVKNMQTKADAKEPIEMKEILGAYSMDVVGSTSFSIDIDSLNNPSDPFVIYMKRALNFNILSPLFIISVTCPWLIPLFEKLEFSLFPKDVVEFFFKSFQKIKEKRRKGDHTNRVDFLQMMIDSQASDTVTVPSDGSYKYKALSDREIVAQAVLFILAGSETTGASLSYLIYNVAMNPDVQQKLIQEVDKTFPNKASLTYDALMQMEYLDMVLNESSRLYPNGGRVERVAKTSVEINGVTIPKGTVIMVPLYALHRVPEYWPEPEEFRPERFSKENKAMMDPYAFLPFGAGPRNCIGMRFTLLSMKVALVKMLQHFSFAPCKDTPIPMEIDTKAFMTPKKPVFLKVTPRSTAE
ncbi:cytochrome P450 3A56-like [Protopterus annectens]|uniref:cytochrome P450 3A56-like n=1 Tax=Protopterus annectens TaxID=7888 RepID=UPI001CF98B75|nr:cytochrome P450 3A56-like [Protopterus annectens]